AHSLRFFLSLPTRRSSDLKLNEQQLFEDLYELNRNFRTYEYKEPVFENDQIIGFYIAEVEREQFIETMSNRAWFVAGMFILSFLDRKSTRLHSSHVSITYA